MQKWTLREPALPACASGRGRGHLHVCGQQLTHKKQLSVTVTHEKCASSVRIQICLDLNSLTPSHREGQRLLLHLYASTMRPWCAPGCFWGLSRVGTTVPLQGDRETTCQQKAGSGDILVQTKKCRHMRKKVLKGPGRLPCDKNSFHLATGA